MLSKLTYFSLMAIFFGGCISEYTPDTGTEDPKLVVKAEIASGAVAPLIELRASFRNSDSLLQLTNEMSVEMYEEDNPVPYVFNLVQESGTHWQAPSELIFEEGKFYFLKIDPSALGIQAAHAESVIPFAGSMNILEATIDSTANRLSSRLLIERPPNAASYYHLIPFMMNQEGKAEYPDINKVTEGNNAVTVLNNRYGMLIDYFSLPEDKYLSFDADFLSSLNVEDLKSGFLYFTLKTVDEDYYLYHRSLSKLAESNQNPFTLPTTTFTNISNGYGLFSAYSSMIDSTRFE